ncbi:MAG: hypothetical protein H6756_08440 [Candidatus Omnitrophica bacterium]|nr:hypothetical protein [Candidatus Omnitrophota bacterium]MCB9720890.1 hypothetical protein [Candidatus Omnitrophota bacterium]
MDDHIEFTASPIKFLGLILIGAGMAAAGFWLMTSEEDLFARSMGGLCMLFGVLCFFGLAKQMTMGGSTVVFSREGLEDKRWGVGLIPWNEIESVRVLTIQSTRMLELRLRNPQMYLEQLPWHLKLSSGLNKTFGFSNFNLVFTGMNPGLDTALAYVENHHPDILLD